MRQAQKKKEKDKVAVVLMLCFCVIALTSIFTVKSNIDKINDSNSNIPVSENAQASQDEEDSHLSEGDKSTGSDEAAQVSGNIPTVDSREDASQESTASRFIKPVNHEQATITNPYSMDKLIYSVTLDQYMTHCGVDIEAPEDTQVLAVSEGTVTAIYEDDRYGISIEITHPNNVITIYSNLSTDEMVEIGDAVTAGQIIGGVGSTGLFESMEPAHLHFEMLKDGVYVNPQEYISF